MIEIFLLTALGVALAGSFAAGLWDLKTSDIPDEVIALMGTAGIFLWYVYALTFGAFSLLVTSLILGTTILAAGWLLYNRGLWGLGDAALLAVVFYLLPDIALFVDYIFNLLIVILAYMIIYTLLAGIRTRGVSGDFTKSFGEKRYMLSFVSLAAAVVLAVAVVAGVSLWLLAVPLLFLFAVYARSVEKIAFRKKVKYSQLKEGDVLFESKKWKGLSKVEAEALRKKKGFVTIKDGVRMGLVFPIALLVTIFYGNVLFWIFGIGIVL